MLINFITTKMLSHHLRNGLALLLFNEIVYPPRCFSLNEISALTKKKFKAIKMKNIKKGFEWNLNEAI